MHYFSIDSIRNKIAIKVEIVNNDEMIFTMEDGSVFKFYHEQNYGESVSIKQIDGELSHLVGEPLVMVDEIINEGSSECGTATWTFYKFATIKGYVTVQWYGESNGYYSESVYFDRVKEGIK